MDTKLSPHFYLSEFTTSQTAARMGRKIEPTPEVEASLKSLCEAILEPVRAQFGAVRISSGYRPEWLNESLPGTASKSQHTLGEAADFTCPGSDVEEVTRWIADSGLPFDQLIYEFGRWTHVSYGMRHRKQVLTAETGPDGKTVYLPGIVIR